MMQWTRPAANDRGALANYDESGWEPDEALGEGEPANAIAEFSYKVGIGVVIVLLCMILVTSLRASVRPVSGAIQQLQQR